MAILIAMIPYNAAIYLLKRRKNSILKFFPTYVLSLKNYTDVDNNIVYALKESTPHPLIKASIERFNLSVEKGLDVYSAFENLKQDINIEEVSSLLTLLENCYLNGGSFSYVIQKYSYSQSKTNIERERINENLLSSKIILIVLIGLSLLLLFGFALRNKDYSDIILNTIGGQAILSFNILTYFFMYVIYLKICKMDE